jgi:large subunit ribosomal protein L32
MALQKRRQGPHRIHSRRSAWMRNAATKPVVQTCPNCSAPRVPHRVCLKCGFYGGKAVVDVKTDEQE